MHVVKWKVLRIVLDKPFTEAKLLHYKHKMGVQKVDIAQINVCVYHLPHG